MTIFTNLSNKHIIATSPSKLIFNPSADYKCDDSSYISVTQVLIYN